MNPLKYDLYKKVILNNLATPPKPPVLLNLVSSWLEYKLKKTHILSSPISAVLYINKTCNYTCSFCYNQDVLNKAPLDQGVFTINDLDHFLRSEHGQNLLRIALMGGEPFINKNIFELIAKCKEHHKITNIVSNGSLIKDEMIPEIKASKLDAIGLSLYDNNLEHIERLSQKFNEFKINYWVQTVVDGTKIHEIEEKLFFAKRANIRNFILSNYNPSFDKMFDKALIESNASYLETYKELQGQYSEDMNIIWPTILPTKNGQLKKRCTLPFNYIHLDNQGTIAPCCYRYPKPEYGNLYEDGWNGDFAQKLRSNMHTLEEPIGECSNCENLYRNLYF